MLYNIYRQLAEFYDYNMMNFLNGQYLLFRKGGQNYNFGLIFYEIIELREGGM